VSELPDAWPREIHQPCTGIAAVWCPIHGTCTCTPTCPMCSDTARVKPIGDQWRCEDCCTTFRDHDRMFMVAVGCPLHSETSDHAEGR
jgi:hypothetical protein